MTQKDLALEAGVTPQVITNLESGLYYKPPVSVTRTILVNAHTGLSEEELTLEYYLWVEELRESHSLLFQRSDLHHSWLAFRLSVAGTFRGFCRQLVYQPSMLSEFEERNLNKPSLTEALRMVGLPNGVVGYLLSRRDPTGYPE